MLRAIRLCSLGAVLLSAAAAADYYGARGHGTAFCAEGSGCDAVRHSSLGETIGQALPALGVIGFAVVLLGTLARGAQARLLALSFAITGGVAGLLLLVLQGAVVGQYCWLCVGVDGLAMLAGVLAIAELRKPLSGSGAITGALERRLWSAALVLAIGSPIAWAASHSSELPAYIASLGKPGKINVVEISDFECPFCRAMHPHLKQAMASHGAKVHFVRKPYPLPHHRQARDAARAFHCAKSQGEEQGEAMAHALFTHEDMSKDACEAHAKALGLELSRFRACVADPKTDLAIDREMEALRGAGFAGLPTVFIGEEQLAGFDRSAGAAPYEAALARAAQGTVSAWSRAAWPATLLLAGLAFWLAGRVGRAGAS